MVYAFIAESCTRTTLANSPIVPGASRSSTPKFRFSSRVSYRPAGSSEASLSAVWARILRVGKPVSGNGSLGKPPASLGSP
eukprot:scaffold273_cov242-Pinguiococcus_pyrenoidosus.AAC.39